jgi:hypothetical protein
VADSFPFIPLFQQLLASSNDVALTVLKRIEITPLIIDAMYVAATPAAARLYGYHTVEHFRGIWQSQTQPLVEYKKSFLLAVGRHFGYQLPHQYTTHILRPDGKVIAVSKTSHEWTHDGELYWLTIVEPALADPSIPTLLEIELPVEITQFRDFTGHYSIAEVEAALAPMHHEDLTVRQFESLALALYHRLLTVSTSRKPQGDHPVLVLGKPITPLPNHGQILYECQRCGWVWTGKAQRGTPQRCANTARRCYNWRSRDAHTPREAGEDRERS